jgi:hypothetical protein
MDNKSTDSSSTADFFRGRVLFLEQGAVVARYRIVSNGSIIEVNNGLHIRSPKKLTSEFILYSLASVSCSKSS